MINKHGIDTDKVTEWQIGSVKIRVLVTLDPSTCVPRVTIESDSPAVLDAVEVIRRCGKEGATAENWRKWTNSREFSLAEDDDGASRV
tara:strand:- start:2565 stop:2828 length:264 start_codon:yes stop_codon:yes gene_type:complete